jgi:sugar transferase EpsL
MSLYLSGGKRSLDIGLSLCLLIMLGPFLAALIVLAFLIQGRPVFFRQQRPGLHMKPFMLYKFRTMTETRDAFGTPFPDRVRLTSFGRFLRNTSLDELPGFWSVVKGEMSLVGPRPLLMEYIPLYSPVQIRRHEARPGITGWSQINGRNTISWDEKFVLDLWYVDHPSFWLDLKILGMSVWKILRREGISQPGQATMERFLGPRKPDPDSSN